MAARGTTAEFIAKARLCHGDRYDYSKVEYIRSDQPVEIVCRRHGASFWQRPGNHLAGKSCPHCGHQRSVEMQFGALPARQAKFVEEASLIYGLAYSYANTLYRNNRSKVEVWCRACQQPFWIRPDAHLGQRQGCPRCGRHKSEATHTKSLQQFIKDARVVHGWRYLYRHAIYASGKCKLKVECRKHGVFGVTPNNHLSGKGCPRCVRSGHYNERYFRERPRQKSAPASFYCVEFRNGPEHFFKVGITCILRARLKTLRSDPNYQTTVRHTQVMPLYAAWRKEQHFLRYARCAGLIHQPNPPLYKGGDSECFTSRGQI